MPGHLFFQQRIDKPFSHQTVQLAQSADTRDACSPQLAAVDQYADFASGVRQTVQFDKLISPDPRLRDYYHACCELFDTLYRQSAALYDRLDALSVGPD